VSKGQGGVFRPEIKERLSQITGQEKGELKVAKENINAWIREGDVRFSMPGGKC